LICLRSAPSSSARLMASPGPREPGPASSRPSRTAFCHSYSVSTGIPSSFAAFPAPISFASFTAYTLYSFSYFLCSRAILSTFFTLVILLLFRELEVSTFFVPYHGGKCLVR
jgi:hypothetical protein